MRKFITALIAVFVCVLAFGQSRIYYDGHIYTQGTKEYRAIEHYIGVSHTGTFVATFKDYNSYNQYMKGQDLIIGGTTTFLLSSAIAIGVSFAPPSTARTAVIHASCLIGTIGGICSIVGLYKSHRWRFDGGGITYTF